MKNIRGFFLSENFQFLEVNFSIYLNRRVFIMQKKGSKFANFCQDIIQTFYGNCLCTTNIFIFSYSINYCKLCRNLLGKLEAGFQQVPLVHFSDFFHNIVTKCL